MAETMKKILISMPDTLLDEVDRFAAMENCNRSEFVRQAMKHYMQQMHKMRIREELIAGYEQLSGLNLQVATENEEVDTRTLQAYEALLAECD